jgi:hypothetical protein
LIAINLVLVLNMTFAHFPQLEVVPIYQSGSLLLNIVFGGIIFKEFDRYDTNQLVCFVLGMGLCMMGMIVMMLIDNWK